jgi:hypothetical protein
MLGGYEMHELYPSALANPYWLPMGHFFQRFPMASMLNGTEDELKYFDDMHVETGSYYDRLLVPIAFFHHIQQQDLSKYGIEVFRPAMTLSSTILHGNKVEQPSATLIGKEINTIQCTIAFDKYNRAKDAQMAIMAHHHQLELAMIRSRGPAVDRDDPDADDHDDDDDEMMMMG